MMKLIELIIMIMISIIKRMNGTLNIMIEVIENTYEVIATTKTKATEKIARVFMVLITGKMIENLVDNKLVVAIEVIKIMEKYISIAGVFEALGFWVLLIILMIGNRIKRVVEICNDVMVNGYSIKNTMRITGTTISNVFAFVRSFNSLSDLLHGSGNTAQNRSVKCSQQELPFIIEEVPFLFS